MLFSFQLMGENISKSRIIACLISPLKVDSEVFSDFFFHVSESERTNNSQGNKAEVLMDNGYHVVDL
jgi:hypothetical protein